MRHFILGLSLAGLLLSTTGCEAPTAARGTLREAKAVVEVVYGQLGDASVDRLPFTAGQISPAVKRMRARFIELRPWFESGAIGNAATGLVRIREIEGGTVEGQPDRMAIIKALVQAENRDRMILYGAHAEDVGHGNDMFGDVWSGFEGAAFAAEWTAQAPAGWWVQDDRRVWSQKKSGPAKAG